MARFQFDNGTLNVRTTQKGVNLRCFGELEHTIFMIILWSVLMLWSFCFILLR